MRKFLSMLLAIVMVLSMAACSSTPAASGSSSSGGASDAAAEKPMIGVTIYKYDDNFMSFVRRAIETEAGDKVELSMNDSQNSQATQNDQVDTMISKGAKALAINLVDPQAADAIITKAKAADIQIGRAHV